MARKIALSNLSLLGESFFQGPQKTWDIAREAGFDGLKINPLRGWGVEKLINTKIPIISFEAPWRTSFGETLQTARENEPRALLIDPILFGYQSATKKAEEYGRYFPHASGVDCPEDYRGNFLRVRKTDANKWPYPLQEGDESFVCIDTWHIRSYPHYGTLWVLLEEGRVRSVDVQTRKPGEWMNFILKNPTHLERQLHIIRDAKLPPEVSVSLEIDPFALRRLAKGRGVSKITILRYLLNRIRSILNES